MARIAEKPGERHSTGRTVVDHQNRRPIAARSGFFAQLSRSTLRLLGGRDHLLIVQLGVKSGFRFIEISALDPCACWRKQEPCRATNRPEILCARPERSAAD